MEWITTTLNDISTDISYGYTASAQIDNCGPKFLRITDIVPYFVNYNSVPYCKIDDNKYKQYKLEKGDLLIARTGATTGYNYLFEDDISAVFASYLIRFKLNKSIVVPKLIKYILKSNNYFSFINNHLTGAAQPGINAPTLGCYTFIIPKNIIFQEKIAKILSNYDDLIENNNNRIKILEEMAQKIYKEWFVDFKFPGHETTTFKQTVLGEIPNDWEIVLVENLLKRLKAKNKYTQENVLVQGKTVVIDQSTAEFLGFHNNEPDFIATPESPLLIFGDHTCKMQMLVENFSIGPNVIPITSKNVPIAFLYYLIDSLIETKEYKRHWNDLIAKKVILPSKKLTIIFSQKLTPLMAMINHLKCKNQTLKQTRDILLPRLISGEIDVENMEIK